MSSAWNNDILYFIRFRRAQNTIPWNIGSVIGVTWMAVDVAGRGKNARKLIQTLNRLMTTTVCDICIRQKRRKNRKRTTPSTWFIHILIRRRSLHFTLKRTLFGKIIIQNKRTQFCLCVPFVRRDVLLQNYNKTFFFRRKKKHFPAFAQCPITGHGCVCECVRESCWKKYAISARHTIPLHQQLHCSTRCVCACVCV